MKLAPLYARVISQGCEEEVFRVEHPLECAEILLAGDAICDRYRLLSLEPRRFTAAYAGHSLFLGNQLNAPKRGYSALYSPGIIKEISYGCFVGYLRRFIIRYGFIRL